MLIRWDLNWFFVGVSICLYGLCFIVDNSGKCGFFLFFVVDKFIKCVVMKDILIICVKLFFMVFIIGVFVGWFVLL